jgi:hypothetical protein
MPRYIHSFIYTCNSCVSVHMAVRGIYLISWTCFIPDVFYHIFSLSLIKNPHSSSTWTVWLVFNPKSHWKEEHKHFTVSRMRPHAGVSATHEALQTKVHLNSKQAINQSETLYFWGLATSNFQIYLLIFTSACLFYATSSLVFCIEAEIPLVLSSLAAHKLNFVVSLYSSSSECPFTQS